MVDKTATHRVVCPEHTYETFSLTQAERHRSDVQQLGGCHLPHIIEIRVGGQWVAQHLVEAQKILQAPPGEVLDVPDGPLTKTNGCWSQQAADRGGAATAAATEPDASPGSLGPHDQAILTADGRVACLDGWCTCHPLPELDAWVRYERWTPAGRASHGYLCPACRRLTQTG